ncbi:MAG: hypothetical protein JNK37_25155 [Verrucomicrobiales bacterium]|nr:hypothetical protein [Verrucomicrobiales bacterium]
MNARQTRFLFCLNLLVVFSGCKQDTKVVDPSSELTALAILAHSHNSPSEPFLFVSTVETGLSPNDSIQESREWLLQGLNAEMGLEEATVDAFLQANANVGDLDFDLPTKLNVQKISQQSFEEYFSENDDLQAGWNALFNDHNRPICVYWVSRIGINKRGDQALIWVRQAIGPLATRGNFYMLTLLDRHWVVTELPIPLLVGQSGGATIRKGAPQVAASNRLTRFD